MVGGEVSQPRGEGNINQGRTTPEERQASSVRAVAPALAYLSSAASVVAELPLPPPQVTRVPDLHLIDAVLSPEEKNLLTKDGLDSCALR